MKIAITGVAGFIGSHLAEALLSRGDKVVGFDNFDDFYHRSIKESNLAGFIDNANFEMIEGDIRNTDDLDKVFANDIDFMVHLAAKAGVRPSIENPVLYQDVNINGTINLLEAMKKHNCKQLVFASSSSVYGNNKKVPFAEADPVDHPISPYAATKKACELIAHTYHHLYNMDITALRFFTVYGPRQRPDLAIHKFARLMSEGKKITMFGDGTTSRDYTYIDDIIQGVLAAIDKCKGYHIYNLGESEPVILKDLISCISRHMDIKPEIERLPMQLGDVDRTFADITLAREELDYSPSFPFDEGISRFVKWFNAKG
jgi:UDP-glucuronate 4-epimerase